MYVGCVIIRSGRGRVGRLAGWLGVRYLVSRMKELCMDRRTHAPIKEGGLRFMYDGKVRVVRAIREDITLLVSRCSLSTVSLCSSRLEDCYLLRPIKRT